MTTEPAQMTEDRTNGKWPLSLAQRRMACMEALNPELAPVISRAYRVAPGVDTRVLLDALHGVLVDHHGLRMRFTGEGVDRVQRVGEPAAPVAQRVTAKSVEQFERFAAGLLNRDSGEPFDLAAEAPVRVRLLDAGSDRLLLTTFHRLVFDRQSAHVFEADVAARCGGRPVGRGPSGRYEGLPPRSAPPPDRAEANLEFWKARLNAAPSAMLCRGPHAEIGIETEANAALGPDGLDRLRHAARSARVTPFGLVLAAFAEVVAAESATTDVVVNIAASGRRAIEERHAIGCFATVVQARLSVEWPSLAEGARHAHRASMEAVAHQEVDPIALLDYRYREAARIGVPPVWDVGLNYITEEAAGPAVEVGPPPIVFASGLGRLAGQSLSHGAALTAVERGGDLLLCLTTNRDAVDEQRCRSMMDAVVVRLQQAIGRLDSQSDATAPKPAAAGSPDRPTAPGRRSCTPRPVSAVDRLPADAAESEVTRRLSSALAAALGSTRVGPDSNFWQHGGSVALLPATRRALDAEGLEAVSMKDVARASTIGDLARALSSARAASGD